MFSHVGSFRARRTLGCLGALASTLALAACGGSSSNSTSNGASTAGGSGKHFVVGSVVNDMTNPFLAVLGHGEQAEASKYGIALHIVSGNVGGTISISQQVAAVQQFISQGVNLILMTTSDPQGIAPAVKLANAANIPVIAVNTSVGSGARVVTYEGADNYQYGLAEGKLVAHAIDGKGNVALLEGVLGDSPEVLRTNGIKAALAGYPHVHIVTTMVDNWVNSQNISDVQNLLTKYGNSVAAVVAEGPEMYAGAEYARSHGDATTKFIAGDYSKEVEAAIKNGALYGTVDQDPGQQGSLGIDLAHSWLVGNKGKVPQPKYDTPLPLITKANVDKVNASWSS
jgi:ribose transport system substrate-binding protein